MVPPVATIPHPAEEPILLSKKNGMNGESNTRAKVSYEVLENYEGNYKFAPIEEAEVSRAMIKRSVSQACLTGVLRSLTT